MKKYIFIIFFFLNLSPLNADQMGAQYTFPLHVNNKYFGTIQVFNTNNKISVEIKKLFYLLENFIEQEHLEKIRREYGQKTYVFLDELRSKYFEMHFNQKKLVMELRYRQKYNKVNTVSLYKIPENQTDNLIFPSQYSGYVNVHNDYFWDNDQNTRFSNQIDWVFNMKGLAFEGEYSHYSNSDNYPRFNNIRLTYDFEDSLTRFSVGQIHYPINIHQYKVPIIGLNYRKKFSINPKEKYNSLEEKKLVLENPSTLDVLVNDKLQKKLTLMPGNYIIDDIKKRSGLNKIEILVKDQNGHVHTERFFSYGSHILLKNGVHNYSYSMGFPYEKQDVNRINFDLPVLSAYHEYGLRNDLTLGAQLQATKESLNSGVYSYFSNDLGVFFVNLAMTNQQGKVGVGIKGEYSTELNLTKWLFHPTRISIGTDYYSQRFKPEFYSYNVYDNFKWNNYIRAQQQISNNLSISLFADYQENTYSNNQWSIGGSFSSVILDDTRVVGQVSYNSEDEFSVFFGINYSLNFSRSHNISSYYDSHHDQFGLNWQYNQFKYNNKVNAKIGLRSKEDDIKLDSGAKFTHQRFQAKVQHRNNYLSKAFTEKKYHYKNDHEYGLANFSFALAFCDDHLTITRPIRDSFVLFIPDKTIRNIPIGINKQNIDKDILFETEIDFMGDAIIPHLTQYYDKTVKIDASQLPIDYQLENYHYILKPKYKSGLVVKIGSNHNYNIEGRMFNDNSDLLKLQSGYIISTSDPTKSFSFFTDKQGNFQIVNLIPGIYRIYMDHLELSGMLKVMSSKNLNQNLGDIILR